MTNASEHALPRKIPIVKFIFLEIVREAAIDQLGASVGSTTDCVGLPPTRIKVLLPDSLDELNHC
jgi:hypothetical protein